MATRSRKKPVKRKPKAASSNRTLTTFGWVAAGLVGCAWAASDGRPVRYASNVFDDLRTLVRPDAAVDRVAVLIQGEPRPKAAAVIQGAAFRSRYVPPPEERTGSIRPSPRPIAEIRKSEPPIPLPSAAPLLPLSAPPIEQALRQTRNVPPSPNGVPAGEERHATRALAIHRVPDGSSPKEAEVASGSSVVVLRSAGDWRYVHDRRSGGEGWVDGRFLAGQSMAADLAALARQDPTRQR